ncbi:MAG TPA: hypothetical protein VMM13_13150 [Euzebya sp.]|nr:hypothetical protein [Euzebya sp.]
MPRFAYAMPIAPQRAAEWRLDASKLLGVGAKDHRAFLLDRGIYRERVWTQTGNGTPDLTLVLWDCDDVDVATRQPGPLATDHERWLFETVIGGYHGQDAENFTFPEPEVLSGTTTMATAAAGTQTMFALPVPEAGVGAVRQLIDRIEQGDLAVAHSAFLTGASIREEWIWLQQARPDTPALLLIHWIGDDLTVAWERLTQVREDPYARVVRDALFTLLVGVPPGVVSGWEVEQLLAMHVRRSDSSVPPATRLAERIGWALTRKRWDALERLCLPQITAHDLDERQVAAGQALRRVVDAVADLPGTLSDTLVSDQQILCVLDGGVGCLGKALLFGVQDGMVASVRVVSGWPA